MNFPQYQKYCWLNRLLTSVTHTKQNGPGWNYTQHHFGCCLKKASLEKKKSYDRPLFNTSKSRISKNRIRPQHRRKNAYPDTYVVHRLTTELKSAAEGPEHAWFRGTNRSSCRGLNTQRHGNRCFFSRDLFKRTESAAKRSAGEARAARRCRTPEEDGHGRQLRLGRDAATRQLLLVVRRVRGRENRNRKTR